MDYITIELSKKGIHAGKYKAIVSVEDKELTAFSWRIRKRATDTRVYAQRSHYADGKLKTIFLHREIMERMLGKPIPDGMQVDHIDGNPLNNIRPNLRLATHAENQRNRGKQKNNKSGYKGVFWNKKRQKWQASIMVNRKNKFLGYFDDPELAHIAYCEAADRLHGEFVNNG